MITEKVEKSEQWLLNGDCRICRKKDYCGDKCKKHLQLRRIAANLAIDEWKEEREKKRKKALRKEKLKKIFRRKDKCSEEA